MELLSSFSKKNIANLENGLFVGSFWSTKKCILDTLDIKHVISIGASPVVFVKNASYLQIDLDDNAHSSNKFLNLLSSILPYIHERILNNENCLVHCSAGKSRSVSVVTAYFIKYNDMNSKEALEYVSKRRTCAYPNYGFRDALLKFETNTTKTSKTIKTK